VAAGVETKLKKKEKKKKEKICTGPKSPLKATVSSSTIIWFLRKVVLQTARNSGNTQITFLFFFFLTTGELSRHSKFGFKQAKGVEKQLVI